MKKIIGIMLVALMLAGISGLGTGCASYLSYQASKEEIYRERVVATGNQDLINKMNLGIPAEQVLKAVRVGDNGLGLAVSISPSTLEVLKKHGWRQLGAAVLDAGTVWLVKEGVDYLDDQGNDSGSSNEAGRDVINVNVNGDGNDINVGDSTDNSTGSE